MTQHLTAIFGQDLRFYNQASLTFSALAVPKPGILASSAADARRESLSSYRSLVSPKFILLDEADFFLMEEALKNKPELM